MALVSTWHLMAKNSLKELKKRSVALHKDGVGYKKIAKTLKLTKEVECMCSASYPEVVFGE